MEQNYIASWILGWIGWGRGPEKLRAVPFDVRPRIEQYYKAGLDYTVQ